MIKYSAEADWRVKVEAVECEKETTTSIWIKGRLVRKVGAHRCYFDTFEQAKEYCIQETEKQVASARRNLELANARLGNAKGLKEPF